MHNRQSYWIVGFYYFVLLLISLSWTNKDLVEPNLIIRYLFLICFVLPFIKYPNLAPGLVTIFVSIRVFSIAPYGYLPTQPNLYLYLSVGLYILYLSQKLSLSKANKLLIALFLIVLFSNLINYVIESPETTEYNFLRMLLITIFLSKLVRNSNDLILMEWSFVIISFCLSIYGFVFYKDLMISTFGLQETQRIYWGDPNYLGCVISIGMVIAFYKLISYSESKPILRILLIATYIIGLANLGFFASRGAFLAAIIPTIFILFKKARSIKNAFAVIFVIVGFFLIISSNLMIFNSLISRFKDSSLSTGSDRTIIWKKSFEIFIKSDFSKIMVGGGGTFSYQICGKAMNREMVSPHNNFLEILYDYGISGLIIFFSIVFFWFRSNINNILGIALILVLLLSSLTLTPLIYLPFWFLIVLIESQYLKSFEEL